ncbi:hypothetical protein F5Y17DRAFT_143479 [Xylariaceae sp. FL0594]|nr:hypothetical protein F5Y17DRAFT_143479 [Xylariaceae sp. FL0594]
MTTAALLFRIAYNSVYGLLCLVLTALLLIVPGDFVRQALTTTHQIINLIVIAIVYVLTILIVLFVYAARLYVTRTVLASIPKQSVPIEKGDVKKEVRDVIAAGIGRSAAIAWEARPKVIAPAGTSASTGVSADDAPPDQGRRSIQFLRQKAGSSRKDDARVPLPSVRPVWGEVEHHGWSSPGSPDLPNVHYATVLSELPNLIEAKAVAQAPADQDPTSDIPVLDRDAVMLLQRSPNMTMRAYVTHLAELDVLSASQDLVQFLDLYERVRFSGRPMSNSAFRTLMHLFAELLRSMRPLSPSVLYDFLDRDSVYSGFDEDNIDDFRPRDSNPTTPAESIHSSRHSSDHRSTRSVPQAVTKLAARNSPVTAGRPYRTAPTTPKDRAEGTFITRSISAGSGNSSAQSRTRYAPSQASSASLSSASQNSVIRLATPQDATDLPYVLRLTDTF